MWHRLAPFIFGTLMSLALAGFLTINYSSPGDLSAAHSQVEELSRSSGCAQCHTDGGLQAGCLSCHGEIVEQLDSGRGYHDFLSRQGEFECAHCHPEHNGKSFALAGPVSWRGEAKGFKHPHVDYRLHGRHEELACAQCHVEERKAPFTLPGFAAIARAESFLGLSQECKDCHEDVHAGGLSPVCSECHGQDSFSPAPHFDHGRFYPLEGGHADTDRNCDGCHILPVSDTASPERRLLTFDRVRGTRCNECHSDPHHVAWGQDCEACHPRSAPPWSDAAALITRETHAAVGFHLIAPHDAVECEACHQPGLSFNERFPDPAGPDYKRHEETCEGCHRDVHGGQFRGKYAGCLDCHDRTKFLPSTYKVADHGIYPLLEAHAAALCKACHKMSPSTGQRVYVGTATKCKACHEDVHGGQFARELESGDCQSCHLETPSTFAIEPYDHLARTGFELAGAHAQASCNDCHLEQAAAGRAGPAVRLYRGTASACASCHRDVHRGQFQQGGATSCESCHRSAAAWEELSFDHDRQSRFPLDGSHEHVPCGGCHPSVHLPDGSSLVQYKPISTKCEDCHGFVQR